MIAEMTDEMTDEMIGIAVIEAETIANVTAVKIVTEVHTIDLKSDLTEIEIEMNGVVDLPVQINVADEHDHQIPVLLVGYH